MNRNVTILIVILAFLVIVGYLLWLRSKFPSVQTGQTVVPSPVASAQVTPSASASATPTASASASPKTSTSSGKVVR